MVIIKKSYLNDFDLFLKISHFDFYDKPAAVHILEVIARKLGLLAGLFCDLSD